MHGPRSPFSYCKRSVFLWHASQNFSASNSVVPTVGMCDGAFGMSLLHHIDRIVFGVFRAGEDLI